MRNVTSPRAYARAMALSLAAALAVCGCSTGGQKAAGSVAVQSAGTAGSGAQDDVGPTSSGSGSASFELYTVYQMPAWTATVSQQPRGRASVQLEKSMFSQGGDGGASMAFAQAAKKWCQERGADRHETMEFVEYWEPMLVGAARKARGEIRCVG